MFEVLWEIIFRTKRTNADRNNFLTEIFEESPNHLSRTNSVPVFIHAFYMDEFKQITAGLAKLDFSLELFIGTPASMIDAVNADLALHNLKGTVKPVENFGRNFGPLFVEFRNEILNTEFFVHLHTKRSKHSVRHKVDNWVSRFHGLFLENTALSRAINLLEHHPAVNLIYPDVSNLISPINFRFGCSIEAAQAINQKLHLGLQLNQAKMAFPAGGMFLARTSGISALLSAPWEYSDFPVERNQIDGEAQHALERLIGAVASRGDGLHAVYIQQLGVFATDKFLSGMERSGRAN